jgi:hypothetical protein
MDEMAPQKSNITKDSGLETRKQQKQKNGRLRRPGPTPICTTLLRLWQPYLPEARQDAGI